jgi:hypothetical protein
MPVRRPPGGSVTKQHKDRPVRGSLKKGILPFGIAIAILLMTVIGGCSQSPSGLDDSEKAAMREVGEIAAVAATLLNVYMDARVTDMLVGSKLGGPLKDALTKPEARADANAILKEKRGQVCS